MKDFFEIVKKLWSNKKTRSLSILLIYLVFFIFVFMLIGSNQSLTIPNDNIENEENIKIQERQIIKLQFNGEHNFIIENNMILYNESIYDVNQMPIELSGYDISIYKIDNINKLLNTSILESTNYVENTNTYLISAKDFESIIYNNEVENEAKIRITYKENDPNNIHIDLKEYYGYEVNVELGS